MSPGKFPFSFSGAHTAVQQLDYLQGNAYTAPYTSSGLQMEGAVRQPLLSPQLNAGRYLVQVLSLDRPQRPLLAKACAQKELRPET